MARGERNDKREPKPKAEGGGVARDFVNKFLTALLTISMVLQSSPVSYAYALEEGAEPEVQVVEAAPEEEAVVETAPEQEAASAVEEPAPAPEVEPALAQEVAPAPAESEATPDPAAEPEQATEEPVYEEPAAEQTEEPAEQPADEEPANQPVVGDDQADVRPEDEPAEPAEQDEPEAVVTIAVSLDHARLIYGGATVSEGTIEVPEGQDANVTIAVDEGYELDEVTVEANGDTYVVNPAADGAYTIPGYWAQNGTRIVASTKAIPSKTEYIYENDDLKVTATIDDPALIPDEAELVVTPVNEFSYDYNYAAYMKALNNAVNLEDAFNNTNTWLYDVAFLTVNEYGETVEVQPINSDVRVRFEFKRAQLTEQLGIRDLNNLEVIHLPLYEDARAKTTHESRDFAPESVRVLTVAPQDFEVLGANDFRIKSDSFSVFALVNMEEPEQEEQPADEQGDETEPADEQEQADSAEEQAEEPAEEQAEPAEEPAEEEPAAEPESTEEPAESAEEPSETEYAYTFTSLDPVALAEIFKAIEIKADVADVKDVTSGSDEFVNVAKGDKGWTLTPTAAFEEPVQVAVKMTDETEYVINTVCEAKPTKFLYSYSDKQISVLATLEDPSSIPDDAEFRVTQITPETDGYSYDAYIEALNAAVENENGDAKSKGVDNNTVPVVDSSAKSAEGRNGVLLYDLAFIIHDENGNEVEIQPEEGTVTVNIYFKHKQLASGLGAKDADDVAVKHLPLVDEVSEGVNLTAEATELVATDVRVEDVQVEGINIQNETVSFTLDSFSAVAVYDISVNGQTYQVLSPDADTFKDSSFNILGGEFKEMANFGLIAFSELNCNAHTNSNFAAKSVNSQNAMGTNNLAEGEVFYISDSLTGGGVSFNMCKGANGEGEYNGSQIVLGKNLELVGIDAANLDTQKAWTFTVKNRTTGETVTFGINGPTVNQNPIRQEGNNQTFIDLASYKALAEKESLKFAGFSASGVSRTIDSGSGETIISRPSGTVGAINLTPADLTLPIVIDDSNVNDRKHVLIMNIDAQGAAEIKIPKISMTSGGYTGEVHEWTQGNVIINVIDSTSPDGLYHGDVTAMAEISGSILCPDASFSTASNVNGEIIANEITIGGEFHRDSITFDQAITVKGGLKMTKEFDGQKDLGNNIFHFKLTAVTPGAPMPDGAQSPMTVDSELDGGIAFGFITFDAPGEYKYSVEEVIPDGAIDLPDGRKYKDGIIYDTTKYTIGVVSNFKAGPGTELVIESYNIYDEEGNKVESFDYDSDRRRQGVVTFKNNSSDGKATIETTKAFDGDWPADGFEFEIEAYSYKNTAGEEKWLGVNGAQYIMPTTNAGQKWDRVQTKSVRATSSEPIAKFGTLTFIENGTYNINEVGGTYVYHIKEKIPEGAVYSADGKTAVYRGIVYDAVEHTATVTVREIEGKLLVTTEYDGGASKLTVSNGLDQITVEKKWFTNGVDVTDETTGSITYKLMATGTYVPPASKTVQVQTGQHDYELTNYRSFELVTGSTINITCHGKPDVKTWQEGDGGWYYNNADLVLSHNGGNNYSYQVASIEEIRNVIAIVGNDIEVTVTNPEADTSPKTKEIGEYTLSDSDGWTKTHSNLDRTGIFDGSTYELKYYVEEAEYSGYTTTYENNKGINTGTITITNSKTEEQKGSLKITKNVTVAGETPAGTLKNLADGTYEFEIYKGETATGEAIKTVTLTINDGESRSELVENLDAGKYTIKEVASGTGKATLTSPEGGTVTVTVVAGATGEEIPVAEFTNDYDASGEATLSGAKSITGREFKAGDSATIKIEATGDNAASAPMPTKVTTDPDTNEQSAEVVTTLTVEPTEGTSAGYSFPAIPYKLSDIPEGQESATFTYEVTESAYSMQGVPEKDSTAYTVTVTISDKGDGTLNVVKSPNATELNFVNAYEATGELTLEGATKELTGRDPLEGETFTFTVDECDAQGSVLTAGVTTGSVAGEGDVTFAGAITYTKNATTDDEGTHYYRVSEVGTDGNGMTYSKTVKSFSVEVVDDGKGNLTIGGQSPATFDLDTEFVNAYEATGGFTR